VWHARPRLCIGSGYNRCNAFAAVIATIVLHVVARIIAVITPAGSMLAAALR
jgi:hypothetical protein